MHTFDEQNVQQWQRWKPENLLNETIDDPIQTLEAALPDAQAQAEIARLRKQAEQQGLAKGMEQGREEGQRKGYEVGLREGHEAGMVKGLEQAKTEQLALLRQAETWASQFKLALENLDSLIPARLVQLALTAVQQLHRTNTVADNNQLLSQIRILMKQEALLNGPIEVHVSPLDLAAISEAIGEKLDSMGWSLQPDPELMSGGCCIVTPDVEFDASTETRWQALCQLVREELSQ
ncbi:flagellar assembly protein FliH [Citrobacter sp. wls619]|uniref:flagellar assembly protein FliH n=1 Tax=Citrobacter sp. wls619 TaxID=2576432 RepID=UPI0010C9A549|nr:flagellar assembly protein FliH [Citrobacter sp. wls619]TKV07854.1 flagellar assembly protein FliH [Citrobacter sp. wls619]